jgi:Uma2 family endonuclease
MAVQVPRRRFTIEEYHQMAQAGIFSEDDLVELIEGEIVEMTPISSKHAACVDRLNQLLSHRLRQAAIVRVQSPIRLSERSEPQPDVALLRPRPDFYAQEHPGAHDVFLVVEVAETSAIYDREVKLPLYARSGIPDVWIVDLESQRVEKYSNPSSRGYSEVQRAVQGQSIAPQAFPDIELAVDDILG